MISCSYNVTPTGRSHIDRGFGADMAFSRRALIKVGGFDERFGIKKDRWLGGEDTDLFLRIKDSGFHVIFEPTMRVHHKIYPSRIILPNIVKRSIAQGMGSYYIRKLSTVRVSNYSGQEYITRLVFDFFPRSIRRLFSRQRVTAFREIATVMISMTSIAVGSIVARFSPITELPQIAKVVAKDVEPQNRYLEHPLANR